MAVTLVKNTNYVHRRFPASEPAPKERAFPFSQFGFVPGEATELADRLLQHNSINSLPIGKNWRTDCMNETGMSVDLERLARLESGKTNVDIFRGNLYRGLEQPVYTFDQGNTRAYILERKIKGQTPKIHFFMPGFNESFLLHGDLIEKFVKKQGNKAFVFVMMDPPNQGISNIKVAGNGLTGQSMGMVDHVFHLWSSSIQELLSSPVFQGSNSKSPIIISSQSTGAMPSLHAIYNLIKEGSINRESIEQFNLVAPFIRLRRHHSVSNFISRLILELSKGNWGNQTLSPFAKDWIAPLTLKKLIKYWDSAGGNGVDLYPVMRSGLQLGSQVTWSRQQYKIYRKNIECFLRELRQASGNLLPPQMQTFMSTGYKGQDDTVHNPSIELLASLLEAKTSHSLTEVPQSSHNTFVEDPGILV